MSVKQDYSKAVNRLMNQGQIFSLNYFKSAANEIPAYGDFLKKNKIDPKKINTFYDFEKYVPIMTKDNYLRQYSAKDLAWKGDLSNSSIISVSSGSSGIPFFWYRGTEQHEEAGEYHHDVYKYIMDADTKSTLVVVCFSMGTWVAGPYTTFATVYAADKGLKINVVTPGIDMKDAINVIGKLKENYDQVVLAGYPPFVKDLLDEGIREKIDWSTCDLKFLVAGEAISEELRDYLLSFNTNAEAHHVINIYGTADAGLVSHETPLSVSLRRSLVHNQDRMESIFGKSVIPTLAQFNPLRRFIEIVDKNIVFTSASGIPLIRYNIKDEGGIFTDLDTLAEDEMIFSKSLDGVRNVEKWYLPFVYIHGRADFTASLYAVLIYPENIKMALLSPELQSKKLVTGKFVMTTKNDSKMNQFLELNIELQHGQTSKIDLEKYIRNVVHLTLVDKNAEYRKLHHALGDKVIPRVFLRNYADPDYFKGANKQAWRLNNG
jgi:phenylacetate-CoA ligase